MPANLIFFKTRFIWLFNASWLYYTTSGTEKKNAYVKKFDDFVISRNSIEFVIPAKAGIHFFQEVLGPGFRRGDASRDFLRDHQV
jgi:hypothetical protein